MKKKLAVLVFLAMITWILIIFYFSSQGPSSSNVQSNTALDIVRRLDRAFAFSENGVFMRFETIFRENVLGGRFESGNAVIRKGAHFGIYMVLGMFSTLFGYMYSKRYLIGVVLGITLPIAIAVLDEYNQQFIGRRSALEDVILDGLGAITGMIITIIGILLWNIIKNVVNKRDKSKKAKS